MSASDLFANLSQMFWLFAQLPQIFKNYQAKSVDGLSLSFLLNWLSGDLTNLIGCLLTNQLPFQRNLAIYFNLVDLILLFQYASYSQPYPSDFQPITARVSVDSESPLEDRWSPQLGQISRIDFDNLSSLARHYTRSITKLGRKRSLRPSLQCSVDSPLPESTPLSHNSHLPSHSPLSPTHRGRSLVRSTPALASAADFNRQSLPPEPAPHRPGSHPPSSTLSDRSRLSRVPPSRASTPVVFLGAFAFLAWNTANNLTGELAEPSSMPQAWAGPTSGSNTLGILSQGPGQVLLGSSHSDSSSTQMLAGQFLSTDWRAVIGRLSAWVCAVLYLTSRLPQIWKNYRRQSVEGLSMMLFIMAFLGNLTYVISILSSAQMDKRGYLREAVPYLIGSGGTLCFDLTIYVQSRLYRHRGTRLHPTSRRASLFCGDDAEAEEAAALLTPEDGLESTTLPAPRSRGRSISLEPPHQ